MIDAIEILGLIAALLTTASFLPQVYKTWKTKSTESLSLTMLLIFVTGVFCWLVYGFLIDSFPIILANFMKQFLEYCFCILSIDTKTDIMQGKSLVF